MRWQRPRGQRPVGRPSDHPPRWCVARLHVSLTKTSTTPLAFGGHRAPFRLARGVGTIAHREFQPAALVPASTGWVEIGDWASADRPSEDRVEVVRASSTRIRGAEHISTDPGDVPTRYHAMILGLADRRAGNVSELHSEVPG